MDSRASERSASTGSSADSQKEIENIEASNQLASSRVRECSGSGANSGAGVKTAHLAEVQIVSRGDTTIPEMEEISSSAVTGEAEYPNSNLIVVDPCTIVAHLHRFYVNEVKSVRFGPSEDASSTIVALLFTAMASNISLAMVGYYQKRALWRMFLHSNQFIAGLLLFSWVLAFNIISLVIYYQFESEEQYPADEFYVTAADEKYDPDASTQVRGPIARAWAAGGLPLCSTSKADYNQSNGSATKMIINGCTCVPPFVVQMPDDRIVLAVATDHQPPLILPKK